MIVCNFFFQIGMLCGTDDILRRFDTGFFKTKIPL